MASQCKWCEVSRDSPNVMKPHMKGDRIPWARDGGFECRPCVNYQRLSLGDMPKPELSKWLKDSNNMEKYMAGRARYLEMYAASPGGRVSLAQVGLLATVASQRKSGSLFEEFLGYLWPLPLFKEHHPNFQLDQNDITSMDVGSRNVTGVMRPYHNDVVGVIKCKQAD